MTSAYAKIPKDVLKSDISSDAKVLYACILDRYSLSQKNGWLDGEGRIYVIFPVSEVMKALHCSKVKARKVFSELENLVKRKRRGQGKPDIIYISDEGTADEESAEIFDKSSESEPLEENIISPKSDNCEPSGGSENILQEVAEMTPNNNKYNNNKINKNNIYIPSYPINPYTWIEERKECIKNIKLNIDYDALILDRQKEIIDEIVSAMANNICSTKEFIIISGEYVPKEEVKRKLLSLNQFHIEYVYDCLAKNKTDIKNMSAYLLTTLYRAPDCMNLHYRSMVNCDLF